MSFKNNLIESDHTKLPTSEWRNSSDINSKLGSIKNNYNSIIRVRWKNCETDKPKYCKESQLK